MVENTTIFIFLALLSVPVTVASATMSVWGRTLALIALSSVVMYFTSKQEWWEDSTGLPREGLLILASVCGVLSGVVFALNRHKKRLRLWDTLKAMPRPHVHPWNL